MLLPKLIAAVLPAITDMLCLLTAKIDMQIANGQGQSMVKNPISMISFFCNCYFISRGIVRMKKNHVKENIILNCVRGLIKRVMSVK